ncbi:DUF3566 domain-containing protein [Actinomycetaceae bacterium TAE3-ERU4]|nr:DUF3566 domain-containing protein [Actinomycetaceae bacterium TAE3-ERU4]
MATENDTPRRYRMTVEKVDPMSVLRISFLLSVAFGFAFIVAIMLLWPVLNGMHVFASIMTLADSLDASGKLSALLEYMRFGKAVALAAVIAVINSLLLTVMSTLGALLYNVIVRLVGGVTVQLIDE